MCIKKQQKKSINHQVKDWSVTCKLNLSASDDYNVLLGS